MMQNPQRNRDAAPTPSLLGFMVNKMQVNPRAYDKRQSQPPLVCPSPGTLELGLAWTL